VIIIFSKIVKKEIIVFLLLFIFSFIFYQLFLSTIFTPSYLEGLNNGITVTRYRFFDKFLYTIGIAIMLFIIYIIKKYYSKS